MKRTDRIAFGSILAAAAAVIGCGGSIGAKGGSGGSGGNGVGGAPGPVDGGSDGSNASDGGVAPADAGPCTTSFGSKAVPLFSFDNGANLGWTALVDTEPPDWDLTDHLSIGAVTDDGDACPGALTLTARLTFTAGLSDATGEAVIRLRHPYISRQIAYKMQSKLHLSFKVVSGNVAVNDIELYRKLTLDSSGPSVYASADSGPITDSNWHRAVVNVDYLPFYFDDIGIAIHIQTSQMPPPEVEIRVDDIWLEPMAGAGLTGAAGNPGASGSSGDGAAGGGGTGAGAAAG